MDRINKFAATFENTLEVVSVPLKPYFPFLARTLLVATFLEDTVRIVTQWEDQVYYLSNFRGFKFYTAEFFLLLNVCAMVVGSVMAIMKRYSEIGVGSLFGVIISQSIGYGLIFDMSFFFRNLSVVGGLLMLLADAFASKRKALFAGLPSLSDNDKNSYLQLFGRILLVCLFLTFIANGEFSMLRVVISLFSLISCIMVVVGFKARWSAWVLIALLSIGNVLLNNWWSLHHHDTRRDFMKYDFFQTLSIMGGFLLLVNLGPGGLSMDEKKKDF